jgi:predicted ABC-type exoprotein transport system permease subunit
MVHSLIGQLAFAVMLVVCGFALRFGSSAERYGAVAVCASWLGGMAVTLVFGRTMSPLALEYTFLAFDCLLAVGLLLLALKFTKVWLGVAMLLQSAELALHGAEMADFGLTFRTYMTFNNTVSWLLLLLLASATLTVVLQHRRLAAAGVSSADATMWVSADLPTPATHSST